MSLRSVFTNGSQERAYDEIAEVLLHHALSGAPSWFALAHVHPERAFCPADDVPEDPQSGAATCAPWGEKPAQRRA
jgi:predicted PhzF superfamily epimerase YddE/YHI9